MWNITVVTVGEKLEVFVAVMTEMAAEVNGVVRYAEYKVWGIQTGQITCQFRVLEVITY
jgi:hypothetical protein